MRRRPRFLFKGPRSAAAPVAATLYPAFADPGSAGVWADLSADERAQRQAVAVEFTTNGWLPNPDAIVFDDTITCNSSTELNNWFNGVAVSGVTVSALRNQKVLLNPAGTWTYAGLANMDKVRGLNWVANGKICYIDGQATDFRTKLTITGLRGLFIRNVRFGQSLVDTGADLTWSPGAVTATPTVVGAGFVVGQTLTVVTAPSAVYKYPVMTVATVDGAGGITGVTVSDRGMMTATAAIVVSSATSTSNATISCAPGSNIRDNLAITLTRSASFVLPCVVNFDQCEFGAGFTTTNNLAYQVAINIDNAEQCIVTRSSFKGVQTAVKSPGCRRLCFHENDVQLQIGDAFFVTNTRGDTAVGTGSTFNTLWPDKISYTWESRNTIRDCVDACDLVNSAGHDMGLDQEHSDGSQRGTGGDTGGYMYWNEFSCLYNERTTFKDRPVKSLRYYGGTQGIYLDDSSSAVTAGAYSCLMAALGSNNVAFWSGNTWFGRVTSVRTGALAASGTNVNNATPAIYSRKKFGTALASNHTVRKCVAGAIQTTASGSVYEAGTLVQVANVIADPTLAGDYAAKFPGAFTTDAEARTSYAFDDTVSKAAFRTALFARFGRAGEGFLDPASWG